MFKIIVYLKLFYRSEEISLPFARFSLIIAYYSVRWPAYEDRGKNFPPNNANLIFPFISMRLSCNGELFRGIHFKLYCFFFESQAAWANFDLFPAAQHKIYRTVFKALQLLIIEC